MQSLLHITKYSFSSTIGEDCTFVGALNNCLPLFQASIASKPLTELGVKDVHKIVAPFLDLKLQRLSRKDEKRLCFEALFVLLMYNASQLGHLRWLTADRLLESYPEFSYLPESEQSKLLNFRNVMVFALMLIPAKNRMEYLIDLVTRIVEGHAQKPYVNGSGAKPSAKHRFKIYHVEGNIPRLTRPAITRRTDGKGAKRRLNKDIVSIGSTYEVPVSVSVTTSVSDPVIAAVVTVETETPVTDAGEDEDKSMAWSEEDFELLTYLSNEDFLAQSAQNSPSKPESLSINCNCPSPNCVSYSTTSMEEETVHPLTPVDNIDWNELLDF